MTEQLRRLWLRLNGSLWFLPALIVLGAVALAIIMIRVEDMFGESWELGERFPRLFGADADSSREMLAVIATSMATIAGVTFSITILAVAQASAQYTPRILRNFMRDRANQATLGTFIGIFAYCLVVLRTVRGTDSIDFVPGVAVLLGFMLVIVGMGVLIFFIHHIADSLQASTIVHRIQKETVRAVDRLFPEKLGTEGDLDEPTDRTLEVLASRRWQPIPAETSGYVQSVDNERLLQLACELNTIIQMEHAIGSFVIRGTPLARICEPVGIDDDLARRVNDVFSLDSYRVVDQDAAYGIRQLVDIAVKALSPSVNDISTATTCIDYLGSILVCVAGRQIPSWLREADGELRVIARGPSFISLVHIAVHDVRSNAGGQAGVLLRLIHMLQAAARSTGNEARRAALHAEIDRVVKVAQRTVDSREDLQRIREAASGEAPQGRVAAAVSP